MARPRKSKSTTVGPEQVVERTIAATLPGMLEHQSRTLRFDRAYQVWRSGVPTKRPGKGTASWQSSNRPKYAMAIIDQALANLAEGIPTATVLPRRSGDEQAAENLENVLSYFADRDHLAEKEIAVTQTALIYGVSPAKNAWHYQEEQGPSGGMVATEDRPTMIPWDPYHCWWDPMAYNVDTASYVVLRSYPTKDELMARAYDEETQTGSYRNLDLLFASGRAPEPEQRSAQNQLLTPPAGVLKNRFELLEIWRETPSGLFLTIIGNRKILLRDGPSPYRMPGKPITISNSRPDLFRIEGISETELIDDLQNALQTIGNLRLDQLKMTVMRGATVRSTVDLRQLVFQPGFLWPVDDHEDVNFQAPPPLPPEAYREDEVLLGRLQWATGISPAVTGTSAAGEAATGGTATSNTLATQGASKLLQIKGQIIHNQTWQRTFRQWGALCRQFMTDGTEIRISGPEGKVGWVKYRKGDLAADFDVDIEAGDRSSTRQQEFAQQLQLLQTLAPYSQAGLANVTPVLRRLAKLSGYIDPQELVPDPRPQGPAAPVPPRLTLTGQLTPEQEAAAAAQRGLPPGPGQAGGSWAQPGQPPEQQAGQVVPMPMGSVIQGNRR